jgi:hypothetical protein
LVYKQLEHFFYSLDNGFENKDIIRSNPSCYGRIRFDTVLIDTNDGPRPARIHLLLQLEAYERRWQLAYVTYFTRIESRKIDRVIGMKRYQEEKSGEFIFIHSIIRSCYMSPTSTSDGYFYLNDLISGCTDIYLRLNPI